jgi:hypothetical protein
VCFRINMLCAYARERRGKTENPSFKPGASAYVRVHAYKRENVYERAYIRRRICTNACMHVFIQIYFTRRQHAKHGA